MAPIEGGLFAGLRSGDGALAFDVLVAPLDGDLRLLPERARGIGLRLPPQVLALRVLAAAAPFGRVVRGAVVLPDAAAQLARHVLPAAGARAPSASGLRWEAPALGVRRGRGRPAPPPPRRERGRGAAGARRIACYARWSSPISPVTPTRRPTPVTSTPRATSTWPRWSARPGTRRSPCGSPG